MLFFGSRPTAGEEVVWLLTPPDDRDRAGIAVTWLPPSTPGPYDPLAFVDAGGFVVEVQAWPPGSGIVPQGTPTDKQVRVRGHDAWMWESYRNRDEPPRTSWRKDGTRDLRCVYWFDVRRDDHIVVWRVFTSSTRSTEEDTIRTVDAMTT